MKKYYQQIINKIDYDLELERWKTDIKINKTLLPKTKALMMHMLFVSVLLFLISCSKESDETLPKLYDIEVNKILWNSAECIANIDIEGSSSIIESGFCWSQNQNPTTSDGFKKIASVDNKIICTIEGLTAGTKYYLKAYAKNSAGISYSEEYNFTTLSEIETGQVTDIDGNTYKTVLINNIWWMAENLRVSHYTNGNKIPNVANNEIWSHPTEGYRCYYDNDSMRYSGNYGAIYNYLVISDERKVCPTGWHIPTLEEWRNLINYCGGHSLEAALKVIAPNSNWNGKTGQETNETGFNGLPGGIRMTGGKYFSSYDYGYWWTSTVVGIFEIGSIYLTPQGFYEETNHPATGMSLRCVKDIN